MTSDAMPLDTGRCEDTRALLPDYLRRRLPSDALAVVRAHLAGCTDCAAAFEAERDFSALIAGTDTAPPPALMRGVLTQIRQAPRPVAFRPSPRDALLALAGTAALFGMVFGVLSLVAVLPPLAALTANSLGLDLSGVSLVASLLAWVVPGLFVAALIGVALHGTLARGETADG